MRPLACILCLLIVSNCVALPPAPGPGPGPEVQALTVSVTWAYKFEPEGPYCEVYVWADHGEGPVSVYLSGPDYSWGRDFDTNTWKTTTPVAGTSKRVATYKVPGCGWYRAYATDVYIGVSTAPFWLW